MRKILSPIIIGLCLLVCASCGSKSSEESEDATSATDEMPAGEAEDSDVASEADASSAVAAGDVTAAAEKLVETPPSNSYVDEGGQTVYNMAEVQPTFAGGEKEMTKWLMKNLKYPNGATEEGTMYVEFVVGENGAIRSSKVLRGPEDQALRDEALKAVNSMPAWTPGQQAGKPVNTKFVLPITFKKI